MKISRRQLPRNKTLFHKRIIKAVNDFYGDGCSLQDRKLKKGICLWLMGRKKRIILNEEQKKAVHIIRNNLKDKL